MDADRAEVVRRELLLHQPDVRSDPDGVLALLHPEFREYGASGRVWDRSDIATAIAGSSDLITATDLNARRLARDVVLLTYRSRTGAQDALRSSVWMLTGGAWLLLFHQGTPVPDRSVPTAVGRPA